MIDHGIVKLNHINLKKLHLIPVKPFFSFPVRNMEQQLILCRTYRSICDVCNKIEYSANKSRRTICLVCSDIIRVRDIIEYTGCIRRKKKKEFKDCIVYLRKRLALTYDGGGAYSKEWMNIIYVFFGTMPNDVSMYMTSFLF